MSPLALYALEFGLGGFPIQREFLLKLIPDLPDHFWILVEGVQDLGVEKEKLWIAPIDRNRPLQVHPRLFDPPLFGQRYPHQEVGLRVIGRKLEYLPGELAEKLPS